MIRPIGVDHPHFRESGVAVLGGEIVAAEPDVVRVHREPVFPYECGELVLAHLYETVQSLDVMRRGIFRFQSFGKRGVRLAALHGVDDEFLYLADILRREVSVEDVELRRPDDGLLTLRDKLYALRRGVRALVELPGERFHPEDGGGALSLYREGHGVELRLGKNVALGIFQKLPVRAFHVVTVDHSDAGEPLDAEHPARLGKECPRFSRERLFLFDEQSVYHISSVQRLHAKRMFIVWICAFNRVLRQELSPRCRDGRTRL